MLQGGGVSRVRSKTTFLHFFWDPSLSVLFVKNISNNYPIILENHFGRVQIRKKILFKFGQF